MQLIVVLVLLLLVGACSQLRYDTTAAPVVPSKKIDESKVRERVVVLVPDNLDARLSGQVSEISSMVQNGLITREAGAELLNQNRLELIGSNPIDDYIYERYLSYQKDLDSGKLAFDKYRELMKMELMKVNSDEWKERQGPYPPYFTNFILTRIYGLPGVSIYREGAKLSRDLATGSVESFALPKPRKIESTPLGVKSKIEAQVYTIDRDQETKVVPLRELSIKP